MSEPEPERTRPFPAPVRMDGYLAWTWRLFRACGLRLAPLYVAGVATVLLLHFGVVVFMLEVLEVAESVEALAASFAAQVTFSTVGGTLLAAIAAPVYVEQVAGHRAGTDSGWRRLRPKLGHVVVSGLYVAMPLLMLVLFVGQITQLALLPAVLGPPVLVHAIVWEKLYFRDAATRAKNLLAGQWGRVLSALVVLAVGPALLQLVVLALLDQVLPDLTRGGLAGSLWAALTIAATTAPVWLFTSAAGTVAYLDLRARFEELDPEALEAEVAAATAEEAPSPG